MDHTSLQSRGLSARGSIDSIGAGRENLMGPLREPSLSTLAEPHLLQLLVRRPEVVGELVKDGFADLLLQLGFVAASSFQRSLEDGDPVRQDQTIVARSVLERYALVEA
jgi:hypothetical protein